MSFDQGGKDGIGQGKFGQILCRVVFLLVGIEIGSITKCLLAKYLKNTGLERNGRDVLVVDDVDLS